MWRPFQNGSPRNKSRRFLRRVEILLQVSEIERVDFSDRLNINETLENIHSSSVTTLGELVLNKKASGMLVMSIM
jgi:hypothetical protein